MNGIHFVEIMISTIFTTTDAVKYCCGSTAMDLSTIKDSTSSTPSQLLQVGLNGIIYLAMLLNDMVF